MDNKLIGTDTTQYIVVKMGVEQYIKDAVPEITEVVQDNKPEGSAEDFYGKEMF